MAKEGKIPGFKLQLTQSLVEAILSSPPGGMNFFFDSIYSSYIFYFICRLNVLEVGHCKAQNK